jgi:DNA polymerase-1
MAYLLDSGQDEQEYTLSHLARRYLGVTYPLRAEEIYEQGCPEAFYEILTDDAYLIAELAALLLDRMDADLNFLYFYGELPVQLILAEMTRRGIPVDGAACAETHENMLNRRKKLVEEITGDAHVNLWDGGQVYTLLTDRNARFPNRGIYRREEVSHKELKQMARYDPIATRILQWRDLQTDLNFLKEAAGKSRVHPRWNVLTLTSRITASDPAVQSVNKVTCRPLVRPEPGWVMIKADYRQIQMRILANLSNDPELVGAFREGRDVHWLTVEMCEISGQTDKEKQDKAKAVNYGILFQMTADGLCHELGVDRKTAQLYIDAFWEKYSDARKFLDDFVEDVKQLEPQDRIVRSYLGRVRRFDGEFGSREQRQAKATLLQQIEADTLRLAIMRLESKFRLLKMKSRIVMIVHDAVYVESPEEELARYWIKRTMEEAVELPLVPLEVEIA